MEANTIGNAPQQFLEPYSGDERFIETSFPFRDVSLILQAQRRKRDPIYSVHRWWARRPPAAMRAILLAMALPGDTPLSEFWHLFDSSDTALMGQHVHDPFTGGGSTLVEAARLGAAVSGTDVDPLAVEIACHALEPVNEADIRSAGTQLIESLAQLLRVFYPQVNRDWQPLHYFYLHRVRCCHCGFTDVLYKDLVLAREVGKDGGVQRDEQLVVFCPDCYRVHHLSSSSRKQLRCCGRYSLHGGNYVSGKLVCRRCGGTSSHRDLQTGVAPRHLLAIEETKAGSRRRIRSPRSVDVEALSAAEERLGRSMDALALPREPFAATRSDSRPLSFGITHPRQLFTARQLLTFGYAFQALPSSVEGDAVRRALRLVFSNALATNNTLCSYAVDYGRLAPLFSVRSYSLPWLSVELNPFHATAGRGTLARCLDRLLRAARSDTRSYAAVQSGVMTPAPSVKCAAAGCLEELPEIDICLFDPPYYDYIPYHELSEFFRAWLPTKNGHAPLYPSKDDPINSFASEMAASLASVIKAIRPGRPLAFTYHSTNPDAWVALGRALDGAGLLVTAIWPVLSDGHMGHHTAAGNCEWDAVIVCRRASECLQVALSANVTDWVRSVSPLFVSRADRRALSLALEMASSRFGAPKRG